MIASRVRGLVLGGVSALALWSTAWAVPVGAVVMLRYSDIGYGRTATGYVRVQTASNSTVGGRIYNSAMSGARIEATDAITIAGQAGPLAIKSTAIMDVADVAIAAAGLLARSNGITLGLTLASAGLDLYRMRHPSKVDGSNAPSGTVDYDPGQPPIAVRAEVFGPQNSSLDYPTKDAACRSILPADANYIDYDYSINTRYAYDRVGVGGDCHAKQTNTCGAGRVTTTAGACPITNNTVDNNFGTVETHGIKDTTSCGASTDASNPAYNVPAGSAVSPDGKCKTARSNHVPMTPDEVGPLVSSNGNFPSVQWKDVAQEIIRPDGATVPSTTRTEGPASQVGQPASTTTTAPDGTVTTTTNTPTYSYTYAGDTITTTINNTTTTNVGGAITTTTTNNPAPKAADTTPDPCDANPDRAGCSKLGTPPDTPERPKRDAPIVFSPTVFSSPASCPSDLPLTIMGRTFAISYSPLCDTLRVVRFIFVFTGAAAAALIFMEGLKS